MSRVTVVDYGLGNLHSVIKGLSKVGAEVEVDVDGTRLASAERIVLPGVGAFADGMAGLLGRGQVEPLRQASRAGKPFLGICLGMQLMLEESAEFGRHTGLGLIPGRVERIPSEYGKVPHVGWARLVPAAPWKGTLLAGVEPGAWSYFIHSYVAKPTIDAEVLATCVHGTHTLTAAVQRGSLTGFQFHPEKSGVLGLAMLRAFVNHS